MRHVPARYTNQNNRNQHYQTHRYQLHGAGAQNGNSNDKVQILDANASATISTGYLPTAMHLLLLAASLAFIYAAFKIFKSEASLMGKFYYVLFTISFAVLSYQVFYWNIGG